jgi:DmsE family decaheme c-type cytochrome
MLALGLASVAQAAEKLSPKQRQDRDAACTKCHDETETKPILAIYQTPHGAIGDAHAPSCQSCHGESKEHLGGAVDGKDRRPRPDRIFGNKTSTAGYEPGSAQEQSETCLSCHKSGLRKHWPGSQHSFNDVSCTSCHVNHARKDPVLVKTEQPKVCFTCHLDKRAEIKKVSAHPIEAGKQTCSDCHNPHGSAGPKLLTRNTVNETCFDCHAEKRGPFLWEHQPVTEDCTNCHNPHGSNITPLLKSRPPFLCQECHDGPHDSKTFPTKANVTGTNTSMAGRGCLNCHAQVHGSNAPTQNGARHWQ